MPLPDEPVTPIPAEARREPHEAAQAANENPTLVPEHTALLAASAITPEAVAARRYRSETDMKALRALGFTPTQCRAGLLMPVWDARGQISQYHLMPGEPRVRSGKLVKIEIPSSARAVLDVPPLVRSAVLDNQCPLYIIDGLVPADSAASKGVAAIGLRGANGWATFDTDGQSQPLDEWQLIPVNGRTVYLVLDSATRKNRAVLTSWSGLRDFLENRGAHMQFIVLPKGVAGAKVALDDFFAAGYGLADLVRLASPEFPVIPPAVVAECYRATTDGLFRETFSKDGVLLYQLANFRATIKRQFIFTNGADQHRLYEIESEVRDSVNRFMVPADEFEELGWVYTHVGAEAIVSAQFGDKQHTRAAIQQISGIVPSSLVYGHIGWVQHDGKWYYVNGGFVIGPEDDEPPAGAAVTAAVPPEGPDAGAVSAIPNGDDPGAAVAAMPPASAPPISLMDQGLGQLGSLGPILAQQVGNTQIFTQLPQRLRNYCLPEPPTGNALVAAIQASLRFLDVGPDHITFPIYATIWRSVEEAADFGLHVNGKSGAGKTELSAVALQHLGAGMNSRNLPGAWSATANALEAIAFLAKDALFVVDDFVPRGSQSDVNRAHRDADRLLRAQGNHSGRARCQRDGTPMEGKPPRGLILSTGELSLEGFSLNSRVLDLHIREKDLDWAKMTECQADAQRGVYAQAMAGFLRWFASRRDRLLAEKRDQVEHLREIFRQHCSHLRTATIAADLLAGWEIFLEFALEIRAIGQEKFDELWKRYHEAMEIILKAQESDQQTQDPADNFLALLAAALLSGRAHVAALDGGPPDWFLDPTPGTLAAWGWEEKTVIVEKTLPAAPKPPDDPNQTPPSGQTQTPPTPASKTEETECMRRYAKGLRVGWICWEELYLEPAASLAAAQRMAKDCGVFLPITPRSLGKCLDAKGLLVSRDKHRNRYTIRKNIQSRRINVLQLKAPSVLSKEWMACDLLEPGHEGPMDDLLQP